MNFYSKYFSLIKNKNEKLELIQNGRRTKTTDLQSQLQTFIFLIQAILRHIINEQYTTPVHFMKSFQYSVRLITYRR